MKLTADNFGDGPTKTAFQNFMEAYDLRLLTIRVQCPECGHVWGIKIDDYEASTDIPENKFKCGECGHYVSNGCTPEELGWTDSAGNPLTTSEKIGWARESNTYK